MDASLDTIRSQMVALLPRLRRFALSLTGNRADADDLVQDTVERALANLHRWERGTRLDSWMFRIAQNLFIDSVRARKRARAVVSGPLEVAEGVATDGVRAAESHIAFGDMCRALGELPEDQRSAVALVLIDGMSYRDAAEVLHIPMGTLTSRLARAREALAVRVFGSAKGA
ncbi:MAG: RNA polymerase sigma factor [Alphaproteobacteria bacterium]|nr:RNA polymerase sigma factor [Alphaproteobacteria bacterium]MDE2110029.1 RNA polymerase sigma factor [Alphaproteobacteria bacterium]MDE2492961.1 RNA polymerase sigma factor [Alphaproteobacteria bacterium]